MSALFSWLSRPENRAALGARLHLLALAIICISYGVIASDFELWPSGVFQRAYLGLLVVMDAPQELKVGRNFDIPRSDRTGVTRDVPGQVQPGYTLFTSEHEPGALLINAAGKVVHEWRVRAKDLEATLGWHGRAIKTSYFSRIRPAPDGGLWAIIMTYDWVKNPGGLLKLSRDSKILWSYQAAAHHDFDIDARGRVYVVTNAMQHVGRELHLHFNGTALLDFIDVVTPDGKFVRRISILDCFLNSPYRAWLEREEIAPTPHDNDLFHTNALRIVKPGDIPGVPHDGHVYALVSVRNLSTLALIDLDGGRVIRAFRGPWLMQHDPELMPDGTLMLFDNFGGARKTGRSRVLRIDLRHGNILWQWPSRNGEKLDSETRGAEQLLPNGNVLITESHGARIIEVGPKGDVVWEYRSPYRVGKDGQSVPIINWARRMPRNWFTAHRQ